MPRGKDHLDAASESQRAEAGAIASRELPTRQWAAFKDKQRLDKLYEGGRPPREIWKETNGESPTAAITAVDSLSDNPERCRQAIAARKLGKLAGRPTRQTCWCRSFTRRAGGRPLPARYVVFVRRGTTPVTSLRLWVLCRRLVVQWPRRGEVEENGIKGVSSA